MVGVIMLAILISLGMWQLDRAEQKREIHEKFLQHQSAEIIDLNSEHAVRADKSAMLWRNVKVNGTFTDDVHILLDNQVMKGEAGYFVFTPFRFSDENIWALVNRGWLPAGKDRMISPSFDTNAEEVNIIGVATEVPATGLLLGEPAIETMTDNIIRLPHIDLQEIAGLIKQDLFPYVIRLQPESAQGFLREWSIPGSGEERHLGYAFQWFALAATLAVIYLVVTIKRVA